MRRSIPGLLALAMAACAPPPAGITAAQSLSLERGFSGAANEVALCLVQELNEIWPDVVHAPRVVEPRRAYRIVSAPRGTIMGARAVIEISELGNRGTRAVITAAHADLGAHHHMETVMAAAAACDARFGGTASPDRRPGDAMWSGYSVPDQ